MSETTDVKVESPTPTRQQASMKDFKILQRIGGGAEGAVYLASNTTTQEEVAIKCIVCRTEEDISNTKKELEFLMTLKHSNIVDHKTYYEEVKKGFLGNETRFYLVMELCKDGSLEDLIIEHKKQNSPFGPEVTLFTISACSCC